MDTIRIGNDINVVWKVFSRNGLQYSLEDKTLAVWLLSGPYKSQITAFQVENTNEVTFSLDATALTRRGVYKLLLRIKDPVAVADDAAFDLTQTFQIVSQSYPDPTSEPVDGAVDLTFQSILNTVFVSTLRGDKGYSAYEVAVRNGFVGTEQEWLDSLHAPLAHVTTEEITDALSYTPVSPTELAAKVDKVSGKGLSSNDFTDTYKDKLDNVDDAVTSAQQSATLAQQTLSRLADVLEEASVDTSVIDVAEVSGQLAATDIQVQKNKNQVFGATKNYTDNKVVYSNGTLLTSSGWNASGYIDVSSLWLESGNTVNWYHGDKSNTSACVCFYNEEQTSLTYRAASAGGDVNREFTLDYPATKYIRMCYLASYADARLVVNGQVVWRPQETVNGLVPQMESASEIIDQLQTEVLPVQETTSAMSERALSSYTLEQILGVWHQGTAITMGDTRDIRFRFRSINNGGLDRSKNRVLLEPCNPNDIFIVNGFSGVYTNCLLWGFYDVDFVLISSAKSGVTYTDYAVTAPANAAYVAFNWYHNDEEPVTTAKFFKIANGTLRQTVESLQELVGAYGKTDILALNPEQTMLPKLIASRRTANPLTIAHFSDMHGTSTTQLKRFIEFCDYYSDRIDVRLNTGDTVYDSYGDIPETQTDWWYRKASGAEKIFNVIGNHDVASHVGSTYDWTAYIGATAYSTYIAPFIMGWNVTSGGENACYYYKDYADSAIRFIVLDMPGYDATEDEWFNSLLADAILNNLTVVIASHFPAAKVDALPSRFTSLSRSTTGTATVAYMANKDLFAAAVKKVDTFITNGGSFACWLVGHTHYDFLSTVSALQAGDESVSRPDITIDNMQIVVTIDTSSSATAQTSYSDIDHAAGTKLQDCFNLVTIDAANKLIKIVRVGCDTDKWMRKKDTLCINYATHTIVE